MVARKVISAWVIGIAVAGFGCEVRTTDDAAPFLDAGSPVKPTIHPVTAATAAKPLVTTIWNQVGEQLAVGVALGGDWVYTPAEELPETILAGVAMDNLVPAEVASASHHGSMLRVRGMPVSTTQPVRGLKPGTAITRIDLSDQTWHEETLSVIAVRGDELVLTCPRRARGLLFVQRTGAWIPALWHLASDGACASAQAYFPAVPGDSE